MATTRPRSDDTAASGAGSQTSRALADLEARITSCTRCERLVAWREEVAREKRRAYADEDYWGRPVPGFGDPAASLLIVGLAPGAHGANRTGRMFTGDRSGDVLYASLHRCGIASVPHSHGRDDGQRLTGAFITAPVRCAPPANRPTTEERDACAPFLAEELGLLPWRAILALGGFGWDAVVRHLGAKALDGGRARFGHGARAVLDDGRPLIGSYHVSQQNTFTGRLTPPMLDTVVREAMSLAGLTPPTEVVQ
jgi:uracil-DNA glycosylase family 4